MRPGDLIDDRFQIERIAGSGGLGTVYRAVDRRTGGPVAIKAVRSDAAADGRFQREAESLATVRHPAIVAYVGHGRVADELYLAMEWLEGEDLGHHIKTSEMGVEDAVAVAGQVAGALAAAHVLGIVHRDVKPSNVFLVERRTDRVKLLDFGIARQAGAATLTASGILVGTPSYMAPEQARGQAALDARVDVHGVGALLYHCLAGRPPYGGETLDEVIARILNEPPPRLFGLVPGVSRELDALVASMLAKDPAQRPADGAAVQAALAGLDVTAAIPLPAPPAARPSSIAVLPFMDMSPARDQGHLCDGIADELMVALTHVDGLRVAARSSSWKFRSQSADAREIGARLGVGAVLEGGVRRAGDRLRVTVQLVDAATGYQRWADRFDGTISDVFAIQDEIADSVATALRGILSHREQEAIRRPGTSAEAYDYFLRGRQFPFAVSTAAYRAAQEMFQRAIDVDPGYAPAYAGLAQMHARYYEWGGGTEDAREAADRTSLKALELAPQLAESHVARGHALRIWRRYDEAEREYQEAIRLNPSSFEAHDLYARMCFELGRMEESLSLFRRAAEIRMEDYSSAFLTAQTLRTLGREEEAREAARDGIRRAERQLALDPNDSRALSMGAAALYFDGQKERAVEWTDRALAAAPDEPAVLYNVACAYATMGRKEEALRCLADTFGRGMGRFGEWAAHDPELDSLRDDPRFQALAAKLP